MTDLLLITNRLIDGTGAPSRPAHLLIKDDAVVSVIDGRPFVIPAGVTAIDVHERTVMPGLIDAHVHVAGLLRGEPDPAADAGRVGFDIADALAGLADLVRSGVTSIRDCGFPHHGIFGVRDGLDTGRLVGPRLFLSGRAICATGGHGAHLGIQIDGIDDARRAVRGEAKAGAEWIKVMITGGTATPGEEVSDVQLSPEEVTAVVEEAHRRGRRVSAHVSNEAGTHLALDAGVDSLEHGIALDDEAISRMVAQETWLVPTLQCTKAEAEAGPGSGIPGHTRRKAAAIYSKQVASFQRALYSGVRIAAGTDGVVPYLPFGSKGLVGELELMVELGMSRTAALASATRDAARMLGLSDQLGTIQPGCMADVLVLEDDPLVRFSALEHPWLVFSRGRIVTGPGAESPLSQLTQPAAAS